MRQIEFLKEIIFVLKHLLLLLILLMFFTACSSNSDKQPSIVYKHCNLYSFENDYSITPKEGDNAYDILDGVVYYGYCG